MQTETDAALTNQPAYRSACVTTATVLAVVANALLAPSALAGPSADVAKRCMHYSYLAYPYKRPGSVRMSGDRQAYFRDCVAKEGSVPEPAQPASGQAKS